MFVTPFLSSLFGFLFAGEVPDKATLIGGGIILVGMMIFNFGASFFKIREKKV
jgi:drug/metabolite transporter (DMT)-like permease